MSPRLARTLLHTVHLVTFTLLMVTGLLLFLPSLRAAVTGGYSLLIRQVHSWGGVGFAVLPLAVLLPAGARCLLGDRRPYTVRWWWQAGHIVVTLVVSAVFTVTGFVMWGRRSLPDWLVDPSRSAHDWLTTAVAVLVAAHLVEVGLTALIGRVKQAVATPESGT